MVPTISGCVRTAVHRNCASVDEARGNTQHVVGRQQRARAAGQSSIVPDCTSISFISTPLPVYERLPYSQTTLFASRANQGCPARTIILDYSHSCSSSGVIRPDGGVHVCVRESAAAAATGISLLKSLFISSCRTGTGQFSSVRPICLFFGKFSTATRTEI